MESLLLPNDRRTESDIILSAIEIFANLANEQLIEDELSVEEYCRYVETLRQFTEEAKNLLEKM